MFLRGMKKNILYKILRDERHGRLNVSHYKNLSHLYMIYIVKNTIRDLFTNAYKPKKNTE